MSASTGSTTLPAPPDPGDAPQPPAPVTPRKGFKFPTGFTVLAAVLVLVWIRPELLLRPRRRCVHHGDDEDAGHTDRHRPACGAVSPQWRRPHRDPHVRVRAWGHDLRDVGGDARLLRPARSADACAAVRP